MGKPPVPERVGIADAEPEADDVGIRMPKSSIRVETRPPRSAANASTGAGWEKTVGMGNS